MAMSRTITIKFNGDTKGLDSASQNGQKQLDGWKGTFSKWNKRAVVASTAVIGGAVAVGKSLVDAGRDGIRADKALAQVFDSMGGAGSAAFAQVGDAQQDMSRRLGETATDVADVQTKLATFGKVWEDPVKGAENFNRATELAFDLEAAGFGEAAGNVTQLGKALNDPIQGVSALTRVGVSFSEAEKDKIKQLQESGDLLGAQELIYAALEDQVGGVAEATTDGGERMRAQWENLQDTLGRQLIPVFEQLMAIGLEVVNWASENQGVIIGLGAAVVGLAGFVLVANAAWKVYTATTHLVTAATKGWAAAQKVLNLVMKANPIGIVITVIAALIAIVVAIEKKTGFFSNLWKKAWGAIQGAVSAAFGWIKRNWPTVLAIITGPIGLAVLAVTKNWDKIKAGAKAVVDGVKRFFSGLGNAISAPFRAAFNKVRSFWNSTIGSFSVNIPDWVPIFGGKTFAFPKMHSGGIFMPEGGASEGLALLRRGERVLTPGQDRRRGGDTYNVTVQAWSDRFSLAQVRDELRFAGAV